MGFFDWIRGRSAPQPPAPALPQPEVITVYEAIPGAYDPDADLSPTGGGSRYYRRISQQSRRDFDPLKQERMQELAFYLYDHNYLAKRVLEVIRDFVVGEGITVVSTNPDEPARQLEQEAIDRTWLDPQNRIDQAVHDYCLELGLWGELVLPVTVNPRNGAVRFGYIDPGRIEQVITDPANDQEVIAIQLKRPDPGGPPQRLRVVHVETDPNRREYGRLVPARLSETFRDGDREYLYLGSCFYFKINSVMGARRGRSDLLSIADIIDAHDQALFNAVERNLLTKSFIYDVTVDGGEQEVAKVKAELEGKGPPYGATRVHSTAVTWNAVAPDLKIPDDVALLDAIVDAVAVGAGLPKTWLSGTTDVNRATATELAEPAIKRLTARQRYFRYCLEQLVTFILDQAELAGMIKWRPTTLRTLRPVPWQFAVQMPDMRQKDVQSAAAALNQAANALALLKSEAAIDTEVERRVAQVLIAPFGVEYDLEQVAANADREKAEREAKFAVAPYGAEQGDRQQDDAANDEANDEAA